MVHYYKVKCIVSSQMLMYTFNQTMLVVYYDEDDDVVINLDHFDLAKRRESVLVPVAILGPPRLLVSSITASFSLPKRATELTVSAGFALFDGTGVTFLPPAVVLCLFAGG